MLALPFADYFTTGAVLTLVMPLALLIGIAVWYVFAVRRIPADTPTDSSAMPSSHVVDAAGPGATSGIQLEADRRPSDAPDGPSADT